MSYRITWKTHVMCFLVAILIRIILGNTADEIVVNFAIRDFIMLYPTPFIIANLYIYVLLLMIPISIVHEGFHGITYKLFGGKVKYGFKGIYAYTQEISEKPIHKFKFLIVLMTPTIAISLLCLLLPGWLGGMIFFLNLLGACGDIYMSLLILKCKNNSKVIDRSYGFDII
jgi:hypothetical protein